MGVRCTKRLFIIIQRSHILGEFRFKIANLYIAFHGLRNINRERRTFPVYALHCNAALHHLYHLPGNRKPEPGTLNILVRLLIQTFKVTEQFSHVFLADSDAGITYGNLQYDFIPTLGNISKVSVLQRAAIPNAGSIFSTRFTLRKLRCLRHMQSDASLSGILHRVVQDVNDNLTDSGIITHQQIRDILVYFYQEVQLLFLSLHPHHINNIIEHRA